MTIGYGNHDAPRPGSPEARQTQRDDTQKPAKPAAPDERHEATPGEGATPKGPQGKDVDPGVG